jgi:hypothetical protein
LSQSFSDRNPFPFQDQCGSTHVLTDAVWVDSSQEAREKNVIKMETKICKQTFVKVS